MRRLFSAIPMELVTIVHVWRDARMIGVVQLTEAVILGILLGGVYGLAAVGIGLVWGVMKVGNFAHGTIIILATYGAYWLLNLYGLDPILSVFLTPLFLVIGYPVYFGLIKPVQKRAGTWWDMASLMILFGVSICLESLMFFFWTATPRDMSVTYFGTPSLTFFGGALYLPTSRVVGFLLALAGVGSMAIFLAKTRLGKAIRATSQDKDAALLVGINVDRVSSLAFGIGGGILAALAGVTVGVQFTFSPTSDLYWCIKAFIVVVLGGIGSVPGSLVGGMIIGLTESISGNILPFLFKDIASLVIFILVVIVRPRGLFGKM